MARMVLCNQYAEVTSSCPPQIADVYSRVPWCWCGWDRFAISFVRQYMSQV